MSYTKKEYTHMIIHSVLGIIHLGLFIFGLITGFWLVYFSILFVPPHFARASNHYSNIRNARDIDTHLQIKKEISEGKYYE